MHILMLKLSHATADRPLTPLHIIVLMSAALRLIDSMSSLLLQFDRGTLYSLTLFLTPDDVFL